MLYSREAGSDNLRRLYPLLLSFRLWNRGLSKTKSWQRGLLEDACSWFFRITRLGQGCCHWIHIGLANSCSPNRIIFNHLSFSTIFSRFHHISIFWISYFFTLFTFHLSSVFSWEFVEFVSIFVGKKSDLLFLMGSEQECGNCHSEQYIFSFLLPFIISIHQTANIKEITLFDNLIGAFTVYSI